MCLYEYLVTLFTCDRVCLAVERLKVVMEDIECQISTIRDQQKIE